MTASVRVTGFTSALPLEIFCRTETQTRAAMLPVALLCLLEHLRGQRMLRTKRIT
ncbi:hypothetical protein AWB78_05868 [Caballeronia calidae]|uniref:Uncharacterized protein n=1 Tax=Caballeronia calidae TaxID=1777139 RepID=A0A158E0L9_9BURK|nr:hypothetical protein AWB78_05868 [Caballeronia calidae]